MTVTHCVDPVLPSASRLLTVILALEVIRPLLSISLLPALSRHIVTPFTVPF